MNVYALDTNPEKVARYYNDRHVSNGLMVTTRLLAAAQVVLRGQANAAADIRINTNFGPQTLNHPWARWTRASLANYRWMYDLSGYLIGEYRIRYDRAEHPYQLVQPDLAPKPEWEFPCLYPLSFPQCVPTCWIRESAVIAYRLHYYNDKRPLANWKGQYAPPWWWRVLDANPSDEETAGAEMPPCRNL